MDGGSWHCTGDRDQDHPHGKEMQKAKWLSGEALQIAVKRREAKSKGCRGPAWGTLPMAKVMRKEAWHMQRRDRASGDPPVPKHLPPKPESAYFTASCSHLHLWLYGGLSPTTSLGEGVNVQLQLIKIPGHDKSVSTYKLLWKFCSLPDRFVQPHVIVHSLPTMRGTRCFKLSKYRLFWEVRKLLV